MSKQLFRGRQNKVKYLIYQQVAIIISRHTNYTRKHTYTHTNVSNLSRR